MAEKSGTFSTPSEPHNAQEEIAVICLDVLKTKDTRILENSWNIIERRCLELFKNGKLRKHTQAYRTIIDGFLSLLQITPSLKKQLLSCCLLLSCCSITRWMEFLRSGALSLHTELSVLVAEAMAGMNPAWSTWELKDRSSVERSLMDLSIPSHYEKAACMTNIATSTPLHIAIATCLSFASKAEAEHTQYSAILIRKIADHTLPEAWESVRNEDLLKVLKFLPETSSVSKEVQLVYHTRISWYSEITQMLWKSGSICSEASLAYCGEAGRSCLPRSLLFKEKEKVDFGEVKFVADAYLLARKWKQTADGSVFESAAKFWFGKGRPELVAAAYVVAPSHLRSYMEESPKMQYYVENLPKGLSSDLDASIDTHLAGLLESITEIADVYGVKRNPNPHHQYLQLRRAAILHPLLMLRRTECFCAAGRAVLFGLSTPAQRYSEEALEVLTLLLNVVSELSYANSRFRKTVSAFIVKVFLFLIDEGRLSNGIPKQLEVLALCVLKSTLICTHNDLERYILKLLPTIIEANKHNEALLFSVQEIQDRVTQRTEQVLST